MVYYGYPNRLICSVLEEMRQLDKTKNYGALIGLISEAQTLANRMESALLDQKDFKQMLERKKELKMELRRLETKVSLIKHIKEK